MNTRVRAFVTIIASLAALALPTAQAGVPKSTQLSPGTITVASNGNYVVIGCLAQQAEGPSRFTITDSRATPPATFRVDGDPDLLRIHIGHTLEIAGPITAPSTSSSGNMPTVKLLTLTYISTKCEKLK
jgi:hypothetical protein